MTRFLLLVLSIVLICGAAVGCQTQNSNEDMSSTNLSIDSTSALTQDTEESTSETTGLAGTETTEDVDITEDETTAPPEMMDKEDSPYYGKIAVAYGDSITYGIYHKLGQNSAFYANPKWCDVVSNELGFASLTNYAVSGISISSTSSVLPESALSKGYKNMRDDAEVVLIAAGTNDFGTNVKLGTNKDMEDVSFCGALNVLCKGLKEKYPNAIVIFVTPIDRKDSECNDLGISLARYSRKIKEIAGDIYGFTIVDGNCTGFDASDPEFCKNYMVDGVHPNQDAHLLYGEAVAKVLLTKK